MRPIRRNRLRVLIAAMAAFVLTGALLTVATSSATAATVDTNAWYVLVNRTSGKVLDVYGQSTADGGRITQWSRTNGNNQQWQFVDSGGGYYRVKSRHSG
ncbi:RICIN domain-containing protein, partial [Streptosporangium sp. H16]|uniref:RICIN domain-containing protein n=1 Tax=Streptosporangium sp. H16 TaxID=3444184 RepID=UPI003F7A0026